MPVDAGFRKQICIARIGGMVWQISGHKFFLARSTTEGGGGTVHKKMPVQGQILSSNEQEMALNGPTISEQPEFPEFPEFAVAIRSKTSGLVGALISTTESQGATNRR